ncbi:hypothetical protein ACFL27_22870 [candidate division CSSED10-310 bacterium]|uniref:Uncharacterized protein n=1 Tax=candidate division CSSED10-310 bacterium TaxID=2855610 RepID=A0ABV6Z3X7_UNCC1
MSIVSAICCLLNRPAEVIICPTKVFDHCSFPFSSVLIRYDPVDLILSGIADCTDRYSIRAGDTDHSPLSRFD